MAHSLHEGQRYHLLTLNMATYVHVGQEPRSRRINLETNTRSPPSSQASSLDDSISRRLAQFRPNAAGDLDLIGPHGAITQPTSLSIKSSQEGVDRPYHMESDGSLVDQDKSNNGLVTDDAVTDDALDKARTNPPKRMANGEIKPLEASLLTSPVASRHCGHLRNNSSTSRGSQIGEVGHLSHYEYCRHT